MGLYKRDSNMYWMKATIDGKPVYESTGTKNKKLAERIYAKWKNEIEEGKWFEKQDTGRQLKEMMEKYKKDYTELKSYYCKARDKSIFKQLYAFFGDDATLQDVERLVGDYEQHRRMKGKAPASIMKELGLLRRMFNVARKQWKWHIGNPVSDIELPKVNNKRSRYLAPDELKRLFEALENAPEMWLKPCITIAMDTGLRLANVCNLQWSEVDLSTGIITIAADKMKNADNLGVPLTERAHRTITELQKVKSLSGQVLHDAGKPLYDKKIQRALARALKRAEITNFHFHDLRHTFGSYLTQEGVDLYTVSKLMGHKDIRMTQRYAHLAAKNLKGAISVLDDKLRFRYVSEEPDAICAVTP